MASGFFDSAFFDSAFFDTGDDAIVSDEKGSHRKKYKMHSAPAIPKSIVRRIEVLSKKAKNESADYAAIIAELQGLSMKIQEAIDLSSSAIIVEPSSDAPIQRDRRIGKRSLTARVATEQQRQEAMKRARAIEDQAARAIQIAMDEEMESIAHAIGMVALMLD